MADDTRYRPESSYDPYRSAQDHAGDDGHAPAADPLAELARLIGQNDPFADLKGRRASAAYDSGDTVRPAPEWLARANSEQSHEQDYPQDQAQDGYAASPYAPSYDTSQREAADYRPEDYAPADDQYRAPADPYAQEAHHPDDRYAPDQYAQPAYARGAYDSADADQASEDHRYRVAPPAEYESDGYYDDGHLPPRGEDDGMLTVRRRGGLVTIAAVLGLAVIGTAGAFGYRAFTGAPGDSTPPIIKADPTPTKIVPTPAADTQNKPIQDRVDAATPVQTERIVPREEPPVSLPVAPPPRAAAPGAPVTAYAAPPATAAPAPASPNEPKRVRTVTIRQQQTGDTTATTSPQAVAPTAPAPRAAAPRQQQRGTPLALAPQAEPTPQHRATDGAYVVQVSAQKTEADAQASYRALQTKYPTVLAGHEASIRRADLGDKGVYYRAQIGPFATADQANEFCTNLKSAGGQCIVQRN